MPRLVSPGRGGVFGEDQEGADLLAERLDLAADGGELVVGLLRRVLLSRHPSPSPQGGGRDRVRAGWGAVERYGPLVWAEGLGVAEDKLVGGRVRVPERQVRDLHPVTDLHGGDGGHEGCERVAGDAAAGHV